jgi:hypothetical protein
MLAPQPAVPVMEPPQYARAISHSWPQILSSDRNLLAAMGIRAKADLGRPSNAGSALHYLVTTLSVKKALSVEGRIFRAF